MPPCVLLGCCTHLTRTACGPTPSPIRRYVHDPLLVDGRKFHFRCYSWLGGDMSAQVYRHAYILMAGVPYAAATSPGTAATNSGGAYSVAGVDLRQHVSNLSVNKHIAGHPGQVPVDLQERYPQVGSRVHFSR